MTTATATALPNLTIGRVYVANQDALRIILGTQDYGSWDGRHVVCDKLLDAGMDELAAKLRPLPIGTYCVTVGNAPSKGGYSYKTTVVYLAVREKSGRVCWHRDHSVGSHVRAGKVKSGPMIRRAREYAEERGWVYLADIRHGDAV